MGELRALEKYTNTESVTNVKTSITGWWYTYPSEKYESQLGLYIYTMIDMDTNTDSFTRHKECMGHRDPMTSQIGPSGGTGHTWVSGQQRCEKKT